MVDHYSGVSIVGSHLLSAAAVDVGQPHVWSLYMRNIFRVFVNRFIPKPPDFFALLAEQSEMATVTVRNLNDYMRDPTDELEDRLTEDEHQADTIKARNLYRLNRAFSTPIDREDIYRSIEALDRLVTHCKSTINELLDLGIKPDQHMIAMTDELLNGVVALERGYRLLSRQPESSEEEANTARHAHRRIERLYRHSLRDLFQGEVTTQMLIKRELYHHLMDGSRRLHAAANVLQDIMVKLV
jgi:uncharacterized protein Yka (UPF0111/DUF47 family)